MRLLLWPTSPGAHPDLLLHIWPKHPSFRFCLGTNLWLRFSAQESFSEKSQQKLEGWVLSEFCRATHTEGQTDGSRTLPIFAHLIPVTERQRCAGYVSGTREGREWLCRGFVSALHLKCWFILLTYLRCRDNFDFIFIQPKYFRLFVKTNEARQSARGKKWKYPHPLPSHLLSALTFPCCGPNFKWK